jgi:TPR repeat protein
MMRAMKHGSWLLLVLLALLLPSTAFAQFYDLDGAYRCLTTPDAACEKDLRQQPRPKPPPPAAPDLAQIIAKVRDKTAGPREIDILRKLAAANDPRAVEVLGWCELNGIGTPPEALAAFHLYGQAAGLGVANARQNQIAIYETRLTSAQRQQVLDPGNDR